MIREAAPQIQLLAEDGERHLFDPAALCGVLIGCFLEAGRRESCYLAEDIALAVEYAFLRSERSNPVFSLAELNAAVIRILEDTGLPEIAELYRRRSDTRLAVECRVDRDTVQAILRRFLAGSDEHFKRLAEQVEKALQTLAIDRAAPTLLVELARHYAAAAELGEETAAARKPGEGEPLCLVSAEEIVRQLPPAERELIGAGVIRVHEVSRLFPSIRLFCFPGKYAEREKLIPPVTEMLLEPGFFELGLALENCRRATLELYRRQVAAAADLPLYIDLPDLPDFARRYLGAAGPGSRKLVLELAEMLLAPIAALIEKLRIPR